MALSEYLNNLFSTWTGVVQAFALLASIVLVIVVAIVTRLAWGKLLVTSLVAGFVIWAVTMNGLGWFSQTINNETNAAPAAITDVVGHDLAA
ncbi:MULTISPECIES: hypothetical protein [unclassified Microbacterium]|jgi:hypothetical protein|uniref:hypothetical protein n=1 Tax=unclassified Microbacterium TaxID=2609290 RepID=UPI00076A8224|nr:MULTISPECIES: hypothetical protein [unclassified Microbacterium]ODT21529.1 MAG: hypothetical protein ABS64_14110 [Microbacterium sp. SCN 69-37]|tara:strand:+ start:228 stop:503 length:276 start_codon:yes stop_codon:yes gene_type:complete